MPSCITHELIAEEALDALPPSVKDAVYGVKGYYYLGAQGPDLFFFLSPLSRGDNFGKLLHRRHTYEWFAAMLDSLPLYAGSDFEKCLAYALGFCTHLSADVVFHPFVYHYLAAYDCPRFTHQEIENDWDIHFLQTVKGRSVRSYVPLFQTDTIAAEGVLYRFVSQSALDLHRKIKPADFRAALRLFRLYVHHFHASKLRPLAPFGLEEFYPKEQASEAYLGGSRFFALSGERGRSADELFRLAAEESKTRMRSFLEAFNSGMVLSDALFSVNYLTGERQ